VFDEGKYDAAMAESIEALSFITTRHPLVRQQHELITSICPSFFSFQPSSGKRRLCNFMALCGHESNLNESQLAEWRERKNGLELNCQKMGFEFVAHDESELEHAANNQWSRIHYFGKDHGEYLKLYRECDRYIGNRIHGAAASALAGARVSCIHMDSRAGLLHAVGIDTILPADLKPDELPSCVIDRSTVASERRRMVKLLLKFISQG